MFELQQVGVKIGKHTLIHSVTADFLPGQLCMVVGPNGAGKTTLLKCLDGEINPTSGTLSFRGRALTQWSNAEMARCRAVLPQSTSLNFPFTVQDVVLMGRTPHETSAEENFEITCKMLSDCDCAHLANRAFPTLSGGEQQRVHCARVLAQVYRENTDTPGFLLLDEPVSALDLSHQYGLLKLLKELVGSQQTGIVCTLHNLNLAAQFSDRCLIIDQGRLVADGTAVEVFTEETLSNVFDLDIWIRPHPQDASIPLIVPKLG